MRVCECDLVCVGEIDVVQRQGDGGEGIGW